MITITGKYTIAKIMIDQVEQTALDQITSFINHPVFTNPVAIMSDVHAGKGSCVGFTMKLTDKVIPNIIGVDIGCGLLSAHLPDTGVSLKDIETRLRRDIPFGENVQEKALLHMKNDFPWHTVQTIAENFCRAYNQIYGGSLVPPLYTLEWFEEKIDTIGANMRRVINSLGTVGGGNHFCELGKTSSGNLCFTVHSGSRNFGKRVCEYWQNIAVKKHHRSGKADRKEEIAKLKAQYSGKELYDEIKALKSQDVVQVEYPDEQLWLEGEDAFGYLMDMIFSQVYASVNRQEIMKLMFRAVNLESFQGIETVHNFIDFHDFIIRKGAIRSYEGETFMIPYNMRDGILICTGKSNPEWNYSAPHGAGRIMSRSQARKKLDLELFKKQMEGIYSTSVCSSTLDEAPDAYKDPKIIEEAIQPTVTIIDRIVPILNLKDSKGEDTD